MLLSYPDCAHLGALPYLVGKLGLNCPIYSTIPVYKMGQMFMYDLYMSHYNMYDFELFTLDDVDTAFDKITQLKYNQSVSLKGKGYGITLTPLPAGHMIGGTIWKIVRIGEEDIVYATAFNHKKERHLNGCELEKLPRPSLLITDAYNARYQQARRRARDEKLMTNILQTLRQQGNVLVCVDSAGRVLELAHMLDQLWRNKESGLLAYSLAMLSNVGYNVLEFAKSMIEWMSDTLMKSFEGARNNPFQFRHLQLCHSMAELARVPGPKVVLASAADLESGFARELFVQWAGSAANSVIVTGRTGLGTLARDLAENGGGGRRIEMDVRRRVELEGAELEEYERSEGEKHKVSKLLVKQPVEAEESSEDSDDDDLEMSVITGKHDIVVRAEGRAHSGFFKSSRKQHVMFPFHEERIRTDEYGEIIQPDEYRIQEQTDYAGFEEDTHHAPHHHGGFHGGPAHHHHHRGGHHRDRDGHHHHHYRGRRGGHGGDYHQSHHHHHHHRGGKEDNKENVKAEAAEMKQEKDAAEAAAAAAAEQEAAAAAMLERPTKCTQSRKLVEINAQVQFIDFEGRSDGESLLKILSKLRPRRVIVVGGLPDSVDVVARHCEQNIGARVFAPAKGDTVDATTETHIYQVRLTEALISQLFFQKAKDSEVAWIDATVLLRRKQLDAIDDGAPDAKRKKTATGGSKGATAAPSKGTITATTTATGGELDADDDLLVEGVLDESEEDKDELTLVPLDVSMIAPHNSVLINELKLSDFKQVLSRNNISSELSGGVLLCANGTCAIRRIDAGKVTIEGCISEVYYKIRELLYEQYAII